MIDNKRHIVFYDSECILCSRTILFLLKKDKKKTLCFAPLGGTTFNRLNIDSREHNNTLIFLNNDEIQTESTGVLSIISMLPYPWKLISLLKIFPAVLRNSIYRSVAKNRYRWFGKNKMCAMPNAEFSSSFLP
jgi:predicted DCC family thiol-disulfide oxidoreductase YuxK